MKPTRNLIAALLTTAVATALVAGCAKDQSPPMSAPIAPISGPQPVDGTYGGLMQLIRGDVMNCGNTNEFQLQVVNQTFTYRLTQPLSYRPAIVFTASIAPDGSFEATSGAAYMRGTLKDGHIHGRISGDACGFDFNADRGGAW